MRRLLVMLACAALTVTVATGASAESKPNKSMALAGSFHRTHVNQVKLECNTCHGKKSASEMLVLSTNRTHAQNLPGPVDPAACLTCHKGDGKYAWYGKVK